jgi:hypothetical protein
MNPMWSVLDEYRNVDPGLLYRTSMCKSNTSRGRFHALNISTRPQILHAGHAGSMRTTVCRVNRFRCTQHWRVQGSRLVGMTSRLEVKNPPANYLAIGHILQRGRITSIHFVAIYAMDAADCVHRDCNCILCPLHTQRMASSIVIPTSLGS